MGINAIEWSDYRLGDRSSISVVAKRLRAWGNAAAENPTEAAAQIKEKLPDRSRERHISQVNPPGIDEERNEEWTHFRRS
jgi:hypothetical protein